MHRYVEGTFQRVYFKISTHVSNVFYRIFIGWSVSHLFTTSLIQCMKPQKSIIYMETPLYLLHMSNEILQKFMDYMKDEAKVSGFLNVHMNMPLKTKFIFFLHILYFFVKAIFFLFFRNLDL